MQRYCRLLERMDPGDAVVIKPMAVGSVSELREKGRDKNDREIWGQRMVKLLTVMEEGLGIGTREERRGVLFVTWNSWQRGSQEMWT